MNLKKIQPDFVHVYRVIQSENVLYKQFKYMQSGHQNIMFTPILILSHTKGQKFLLNMLTCPCIHIVQTPLQKPTIYPEALKP